MRYPLIEFLTGVLFLGVYLVFKMTPYTLIGFAFTAILIVVALIDFDTMEIYDRFHIMIIILAILVIALDIDHVFDHLLGGLVISIPLFLIAYFTQGMGGGDVKLVGVCGFFLGVIPVFIATMVGIFSGGIFGAYLLLAKKKNGKSMIPFGPFLCFGMYIGMLFGNQIFQWYIGLFF
jgi:leader peptidase (prepilin peptidase)/N-methyltransferase